MERIPGGGKAGTQGWALGEPGAGRARWGAGRSGAEGRDRPEGAPKPEHQVPGSLQTRGPGHTEAGASHSRLRPTQRPPPTPVRVTASSTSRPSSVCPGQGARPRRSGGAGAASPRRAAVT